MAVPRKLFTTLTPAWVLSVIPTFPALEYGSRSLLNLFHGYTNKALGWVIAGFVGTAIFALILMASKYLLAHDPWKSPVLPQGLEPENGTEHFRLPQLASCWSPNPVDV